jgi:hypothetical protein
MSTMQQFYDGEIAAGRSTPYRLLAEAAPEDILAGDLLEWYTW